ncbi:MAG: hypothetical protein PF489_03365 [Salinivirgaceae bacterium]|jgi:hypothetical protein|nr:hypothetical protein [Salinivirgaceae bacterium]
MKTNILVLLFFFSLIVQNAFSRKIGGGELNSGIYTNQKAIENFQNMRFGLIILNADSFSGILTNLFFSLSNQNFQA